MTLDNSSTDNDVAVIHNRINYVANSVGGSKEEVGGSYNEINIDSSSTQDITGMFLASFNRISYNSNVDALWPLYATRNRHAFSTDTINNTISSIVGNRNDLYFESGAGATITDAYGSENKLYASGGTINNYYMFKGTIIGSTTTVDNQYGLYLDNLIGTNSWGIYQTGTDDLNYFAGNVGIGT